MTRGKKARVAIALVCILLVWCGSSVKKKLKHVCVPVIKHDERSRLSVTCHTVTQ